MNLSSSRDASVHWHLPNNFSDLPLDTHCYLSSPNVFIVTTFFTVNIVILIPLCVFILHHGLRQWRRNRSSSLTASMNHNDYFTYNMVTMELIGVFGCFLICCGIHTGHNNIFLVGFYCFSLTWIGQMFFHVLTCVDRYLAVVHPVLYLTLKSDRWIRIRNASVACTWLLCCVLTGLLKENIYMVFNFSILISFLLIVSFCSISVLRVLIRPAAAKKADGKKMADQSKLRAFCTIVVILGVLLVRFTLNMFWSVMFVTQEKFNCLVMTVDIWFNLPTSLVLPLLYMHKENLLMCLKKKTSA